jgi:hypothetical protein
VSEAGLKTDPTLHAVLEQPNKKSIKHDLLAVGEEKLRKELKKDTSVGQVKGHS